MSDVAELHDAAREAAQSLSEQATALMTPEELAALARMEQAGRDWAHVFGFAVARLASNGATPDDLVTAVRGLARLWPPA